MLAEAVCKLEGFTYAPDETLYWQHGRSSERDFIYVTTQNLSREQLQHLSDEVGPQRTLLVCCSAFRARADQFPNLTLKKIPKAVLHRCEWGHDDYSLKVENLPAAPPRPGELFTDTELAGEPVPRLPASVPKEKPAPASRRAATAKPMPAVKVKPKPKATRPAPSSPKKKSARAVKRAAAPKRNPARKAQPKSKASRPATKRK